MVGDNTMSKQYVNIRKKTSKAGNEYLSGFLKDEDTNFYINKTKEGKSHLSKQVGKGTSFEDIGIFETKSGDYGNYEQLVADGKLYRLAKSKNGGEPLTYSQGERAGQPVTDRDGQQVYAAPLLLTIQADKPKEN
jgi:hypothetical protein